jgi:hypothetical protein
MNPKLLAVLVAMLLGAHATAQNSTSTGTGGAGGAGGSASGGSAAGGAATNTNSITGTGSATSSSGGGTAYGGVAHGGAAQGGSSTAQGGTSTSQAAGGNSGGNTLGADVQVNYILPTGPVGKDGLGVGVDPATGRVVSETIFKYEGAQKIKNTPDLGIGGPASGPCNGFSGGIGVTVPGFGIGANMSSVDEGCSHRETARIAAMLGRMDIANALMENLPIVQAAMAAKAARGRAEAPASAPIQPAVTTPLPPQATPTDAENLKRQKELERQQAQAVQAIQRANTMATLNDTIKFTDAASQSRDKTPQEAMAEEANRQLAAKAAPATQPAANAAAVTAPAPALVPASAPGTPPPQQQVPNERPQQTSQAGPAPQQIAQATTRPLAPAQKIESSEDRAKIAKSVLNF